MISLGTLPTGNSSEGFAINADGVIVGGSNIFVQNPPGESPPGTYVSHGFLCTNGQMQDLNDLIPANTGWVLGEATGINDKGEIVGNGTINGNQHAYLLTLNRRDPGAKQQ